MIRNKTNCPWDKMRDEQLIDPAAYKTVPEEGITEKPSKQTEQMSDVHQASEESVNEKISEVENETKIENKTELQDNESVSERNASAEEIKEDTAEQRVYIHISPSQKEMFEHLSCAEREKKKAYIAFAIALISFLGCFLGLITAGFFLVASSIHLMAGLKLWKKANKESTYISDPKRGYLRIERGWLHCEQGVGTQYEELHIPISKISATVPYGSDSDRQLALTFSSADAQMSVNGTTVEEGLYEIRGGVYDIDEWRMFIDAFSGILPNKAKFDVNFWDKEKGPNKALLIFADVLVLVGVIISVLLRHGIICLPF